jgi:tetratricopeptide (TPR) repeat protein
MRLRRAFILSIVMAAIAAAGSAASAQERPNARPGLRPLAPDQAQEAKRRAPAPPKLDRAQRLSALFEALKAAPSAQAAQAVESRIEAMMMQSGSDTADLLMVRARTVIEAKDFDLSLRLLDSIVELSPDFTEAYAQRATVHYLKKDVYRSLADLRVVVSREPRHFAALAGLGVILQDIGEDKRALDAYRRAVQTNPHIRGIQQIIKRLEVKVEGREI